MSRPTDLEQRRRRRDFWRALDDTGSFFEASKRSGLDARRVLRMLDDEDSLRSALVRAHYAQRRLA